MTSSIYQSQQINAILQQANSEYSLTESRLMQAAGQFAFEVIRQRFPHLKNLLVVCGSGNNGGDGYVVAALAKACGVTVTIWQVGEPGESKPAAKAACDACQQAGIPMYHFERREAAVNPDVIVDAICGVGLQDALRESVLTVVELLKTIPVPVVALDVPTGINADTGALLGCALPAVLTVTFIGLKLGLLTGSGTTYAGEIVCSDLGLPAALFDEVPVSADKLMLADYRAYLPPRPRDSHKGLSGHVLIVGGDNGYSGAPCMVAMAALRVGAGLVSVATRTVYANHMMAYFPEMMCHGIDDANDLQPLLAKADVVVIGPGLSQSTWSQDLWRCVSASTLPKVVDADALNLLAKKNQRDTSWVLTPHPGEAARLLATTPTVVQQDRLQALKSLREHYDGVCVLKGAGSMVLAPHATPLVCDLGNPGMATAGMGDLLSGVIGGLIAQGIPMAQAAALGVGMHARAGDLAAKMGERGMIATDLLPYLRQLANNLTE